MIARSPQVSVVIPTRNRRALLARALGTVLRQRGVALEVFVVDDGSTDGTAAEVRARGDARVTVLRHETARGVATARNAGLAAARAPWVAFLDDDDMWAPSKLALQLAAGRDSGTQWICGGAVVVDERLDVIAGKPPPRAGELGDLLAFNIVPGGGSGPVMRTALARAVGGFDPALAILADWDMWIRLLLATPPGVVWHPLVAYLRHNRSMSHCNDGFLRELDHVVAKHAGARRAWRVEFERDRWLRWAAAMSVRSGNRRDAVQTYVHLARRYRDLKSVARAVLGVFFPRLIVRYWHQNALRRLPPGWGEEVEAWLAPLRARTAPPAIDAPAGGVWPRGAEAGAV